MMLSEKKKATSKKRTLPSTQREEREEDRISTGSYSTHTRWTVSTKNPKKMLITYFVQNSRGDNNNNKEKNVAVYEIEEDHIRVKDLIGRHSSQPFQKQQQQQKSYETTKTTDKFPLGPARNLHFRCKVYLGKDRKRYGWMDLDRNSDRIVPKYNGCICLKLLQLRPGLLVSRTDSLRFKHKHTSVMDTVKENAKMHLKSVVGSLSGFMSQFVSEKQPREPPSKAARAEINRLKRWSGTSVSSKVHEKLLKRLWKARVPNSSFKQKSSKWVDMGFQSSNPVSDFRGGGELALRSLVYVVFEPLCSREPHYSYPFTDSQH